MMALLILLMLIILFFVVQFEFNTSLRFNLLSNTGKLTVQFFNIKVIDCFFCFKKGYIEIQSKYSQRFLPFKLDYKSIKEVSKLDDFIFSKIYFKKVKVLLNVGIKNDAFKTAMLSGLLNVLSSNMLIALKNAKTEVLESIKIYDNFEKTEFKGTIKCKISISIIDIIWCIVENIAYKQIYKNSIKNNE